MTDDLLGKRVAVYLHSRKQCFSVQYKGRVVAHVDEIALEGVEFRVSQAGRNRVLRTGQKNVHAKVWGTVVKPRSAVLKPIYYNPYKTESFVVRKTQKPIHEADYALCRAQTVWVRSQA